MYFMAQDAVASVPVLARSDGNRNPGIINKGIKGPSTRYFLLTMGFIEKTVSTFYTSYCSSLVFWRRDSTN